MAIRFNGTSAYLSRTANVPPLGGMTACCWFSLTSTIASGGWAQIIGLGNTSGTPHGGAGASSIGGTGPVWGANNSSSQASVGFSPAVGEACFIAVTLDGTNMRVTMRRYRDGVLSAAQVTAITGTANAIRFANSVFDGTDFFPGDLWQCRAWDRVLTDAELLAESFSSAPVSRRSLNFAWRLRTPTDIVDISGNNRPPTVTGTLTQRMLDAERLLRRPDVRRRVYGFAVVGGSTFPVTLSAALTSNALVQRAVSVTRSAAASGTATVPRQAQATRSSIIVSTPTLTRTAQLVRSISQTAAAAIVRTPQRVLAAATGSSPALQRAIGTIRSVTQSSATTLVRRAQKTLSAATTESVTVTTLKAKLLTLSAAIGSSATVVRLVSAVRAASGGAAAALANVIDVTRSATGSSGAAVVRQVNAIRNATQLSGATLAAQKVLLLTLSAATALVATVVKQVQATRTAAAIVTVATAAKLMTKTFNVSQVEVATLFQGGVPVWPAPADVRAGVAYGPTGTEYVGTFVAASGGGSFFRRR